jgi:hypothetical protein
LRQRGRVVTEAIERSALLSNHRLHRISHQARLLALEDREAALTQLERGKPALRCFGRGRGLGKNRGGQHAVGQIITTPVMLTLRNQQAAVEEQFLKGGLHELRRAPDATGRAIVVEVLRAQRTTMANFSEELIGENLFTRSEATRPRAVGDGTPMHRAGQMRPGLEWKSDQNPAVRHVMLERAPLRRGKRSGVAVQVAHQVALAIAGDAIAQNQVVHPPADIERIDLDVPMPVEGGTDVWIR